jgi:adenosylcobinamide-phosphate synthase
MSFFAILLALIFEQIRPLPLGNPIHEAVRGWLKWVLKNFDAGRVSYGRISWILVVACPVTLVAVVYWILLYKVGWWAGLLWSVVVVYSTVGFRQFSHNFTIIRDALFDGNEEKARTLLAHWKNVPEAYSISRNTTQQLIEYSILNAHRMVFGVMAWYCIGALFGLGPTGAVFYRVAGYVASNLQHERSKNESPISELLKENSYLFWYWIDWLPVRLTVLGFAFMGSFEDTIDCWRRQQSVSPKDNNGLLLAGTSGSLNIQLGDKSLRPEAPVVQSGHLRAVVGLVWRMVVIWVVILALLSIARILG